MIRRFLPGLRGQLAVAIALVTAVAVLASFLALYGGTSARLQSQVNSDLTTHQAEWQQFIAGVDVSTPSALEAAARRFIAGQHYRAASSIVAVQVNGGPTVANDGEIVAQEEAKQTAVESAAGGLFGARIGLSTATVAEAGRMQVLTQAILFRGRRVGTLRIADPLAAIQQAKTSLLRTFLIVGLLALAASVLVGIALAALISSPLRRIARVAAAVDGGDLSMRAGPIPGGGEVGVFSEAFDHMLDRLERSFKRQRDFVSDASHELRTPLSVLRAQVELLDRETREAPRHEATVNLLHRLDDLDRLVADMLTLASAEAGQLIEPRAIDLNDYFDDLRRDLPLFGDGAIELRAVDGILQADPTRLTQVLRNLIRNAVTHADADGTVRISARASGDQLEITVTDDGVGIPPEELAHIFERFRRLDQSRSRDHGGTGLGLAIARAIVEAHGGSIRAESGPGQGATFRVVLPGYREPGAGTR